MCRCLVVSHDRELMGNLGITRVLEMDDGRLAERTGPGGLPAAAGSPGPDRRLFGAYRRGVRGLRGVKRKRIRATIQVRGSRKKRTFLPSW